MRPYREILEELDQLWTLAQNQAEGYFTHPFPETVPPDLKNLNTAVTLLKRIQDARRVLNLEILKLETVPENAPHPASLQRPDPDDADRVSRILERFQAEEREEPPRPADSADEPAPPA